MGDSDIILVSFHRVQLLIWGPLLRHLQREGQWWFWLGSSQWSYHHSRDWTRCWSHHWKRYTGRDILRMSSGVLLLTSQGGGVVCRSFWFFLCPSIGLSVYFIRFSDGMCVCLLVCLFVCIPGCWFYLFSDLSVHLSYLLNLTYFLARLAVNTNTLLVQSVEANNLKCATSSVCLSHWPFFLAPGVYYYMNASWPRQPGDKARLTSLKLKTQFPTCFGFYFHMKGEGMGTLRLFIDRTLVWVMSGNQSNRWIKASIPLNVTSGYHWVSTVSRDCHRHSCVHLMLVLVSLLFQVSTAATQVQAI